MAKKKKHKRECSECGTIGAELIPCNWCRLKNPDNPTREKKYHVLCNDCWMNGCPVLRKINPAALKRPYLKPF